MGSACAACIFAAVGVGTAQAATFGYSDNSSEQGSISPSIAASKAAASGADIVRFTVHWGSVQPQSQQQPYNWAAYDPIVSALRAEGILPLPVFVGTPGWARPLLCNGGLCPPASNHRTTFGAFARAGAERWHLPSQGYPLAGVQIWNEPNWQGYWPTLTGPNGGEYASLYTHSAAAVSAFDDTLPVIAAGLDGRSTSSSTGYKSIPTFLNEYYNALDRTQVDPQDALGVHAYVSRFSGIMSETRGVRDLRDAGRRLWVTETGSSTGEPGVTEAVQAQHIEQILDDLDLSTDVDVALVHTLFEIGSSPSDAALGVLKTNAPTYTPKLAYCAIAARNLEPIPPGC